MTARAHLLAVALGVGVVAHGVRLAAVPGFVVATPAPVRDTLRLEGLQAPLRPDGALRVTAALARPGHDRVGPLWLGAPSHVVLEGVEVVCSDAAQPARRLRAATARWDGAALTLDGPVQGDDATGRTFVVAAARVVDGAIVLAR